MRTRVRTLTLRNPKAMEDVTSALASAHTLPDPGWDSRQNLLQSHTLQGLAWAHFQSALGRRVMWDEGPGWSWIGVIMRPRGVRYLYTPYGPTVTDSSSLEASFTSMRTAANRERLDFVRCEPNGVSEDAVKKLGLRRVAAMQPEHTRLIDLTLDEARLRHDLSSGHRNAVNGATRRGLDMEITSDPSRLQDFLRLLHISSSARRFNTHPDTYFETMINTLSPRGAACFGFARLDGAPVAGSIVLDYGGTRSYAHAGKDPSGDRQRAATALVWELIIDGKRNGLTSFDLWGVSAPDAPPDHPWAGFSQFKREFGGYDISFAGTWEAPVKPAKYEIYRVVKRCMSRA